MESINWNYWLDLTSVKEWHASALSLGINPKRIIRKLNRYSEPAKFEYEGDESIGVEKLQEFLNRLDIIQNNKYVEKFYLGLDEVYLEGFVKWAITKKSFQNYFPKELQAYWAQELVDNLNNKLTQPKVTQKWQLKPGKAYPGYRLALFEFLEKEYKDGKEYPPNAYDFIAKLKQDVKANQVPEDIYVRNKGIDYKTKDGVTNKADLKAINQAIDNLIIKLSEDE